MTTGPQPPNQDELMGQFWDYLQGELPPEQVASFEAALRDSPEAIEAGIDLIEVMVMAREACQREGQARKELFFGSSVEYKIDDVISAVADPQAHAAKTTLADLARLEAQAETTVVDLSSTASGKCDVSSPTKQATLSFSQWRDAGGYLVRHSLNTKAAIIGGLAAVLMLSLFLFNPWGNEPNEPVIDPLANTPLRDTPAHRPVVAMLTDAVGAQWRSDDKPVPMPMGAQLVAYERFTLTHGFAEITTGRGATALLQAPATFELTDSDNAIRLHSGRLVGKCLTQASKGFTVHAPGMDVVDLGTEFGVDADVTEGSTVLVMAGSVRAQPTEQSPLAFTPVVLREDQARQIAPQTGGLGMIAKSEAPVFYEEPPHPYVAAVLDAGPVAYWRFEDDRNGVISNEVKPGWNDLRMHGSAKILSEGLIGDAGWLDNKKVSSSFFNAQDHFGSIGPDDTFTIELWFWLGQELSSETTSSSLVGIYGEKETNHVVHLELMPPDSPLDWHPKSIRAIHSATGGEAKDPGGIHGLFSEKRYQLRSWQHVVLVRQNSQLQLYLNGERVGELSGRQAQTDQAAFAIGRSIWLDRWLEQGKVDEVSFYRRALSATEVRNHWRLGHSGDNP